MSIIETLNEKFPIRKSRKQKDAFRTWFIAWAQEQSYTAEATKPKGLFGSSNVVVGDPETAQVVFTGHFDTPAVMPVPNFITPRNVLVYILYQVVMLPVMLAPGILIGAGAGWLGSYVSEEVGFLCGYFTTMALMIVTFCLLMFGPANKHNVNDNTSGVAAVMELMTRLPAEQRSKAAFILFDNEEKGLVGSAAYASAHKAVKKEKLLINMDCVGDGEHMLFCANKRTRKLPEFPWLVEAMEGATGRNFLMNAMEKCVYPSDQSNYRYGIAVCACNKMKVLGYYCDKIHTKKDTVCEQANLDFLAEGLSAFVARL